jgi:hypothetical protein
MTNFSPREPAREMASHTVPRQVVTLAATAQELPPDVAHRLAKSAQCRTVHGQPEIAVVPQQDRAQIRPLFPNGPVYASPQFFFQSLQLRSPPLAHRLSQSREPSFPSLATTMRDSQEVEPLRCAVAPILATVFRIAATLDDSCFVGVQLQAKPYKSFAQLCQKQPCFLSMLKSRDEVMRRTHKDSFPARLLPSSPRNPEIEYIVEIEIRQQTDLCVPLSTLRRRPHRRPLQDSGPLWVAIPSRYETCLHYTLPVQPAQGVFNETFRHD